MWSKLRYPEAQNEPNFSKIDQDLGIEIGKLLCPLNVQTPCTYAHHSMKYWCFGNRLEMSNSERVFQMLCMT